MPADLIQLAIAVAFVALWAMIGQFAVVQP